MNNRDLPPTLVNAHVPGRIPTEEQCRGWWESFGMLAHIREHSLLVADVATTLAELAAGQNLGIPEQLTADEFVNSVRVAGLLHDLGKTYSIAHGGNHSQIGAAWAMELTGNPRIAQGVIHHVHWPGTLDLDRHFLPLAVIYGDKRVKHDTLVDIDERFADLMERYGHTERSRGWIMRSHAQGRELEHLLSTYLGEDIHAYPFDRRRLVR
jgi:putative nucleotidyltransferase with HDIG domain